jgi:hypothetical protein
MMMTAGLANSMAEQPEKTRLLITAIGSLVATNLLEALAFIGRERFFIIGTNSEPEAANNFACDVVYKVPPTASGGAYRAALAAIGKTEAPELWIPARDDDVLELAKLFAGKTLPGIALVGSLNAAGIICDKWLSYCFAIERGLKVAPTADTFEAALKLVEDHGFPLIVKPRRGYGSKGSCFVTDAAQLERALSVGNSIAQVVISPAPNWADHLPDLTAGWPLWYSYVDPGQYASQWMIAPDGAVIEIGATLNTMICGRPERSVRVDDPSLSRTAGGYARELSALGWRGPLNVQCRRGESNAFYMFELAGRFAGGLGGREMLGIPETETVLSTIFPDRFGRVMPLRPILSVALKQPLTLGIDTESLARLREEGLWRRSC